MGRVLDRIVPGGNAMRTVQLITTIALMLAFASALAGSRPELKPVPAHVGPFHGGAPELRNCEVDSVFLLGDPENPGQNPVHNGTFEDAAGNPDWAGWTTWDGHAPDPIGRWQVSPFRAVSGEYSLWCGAEFDGDPGYGNDWLTAVVFTHAVADPDAPVTVRWTAQLRIDTEPGYDYVRLEWNLGGVWNSLQILDGSRIYSVDETVVYEPGEFVGEDQDAIQLRVLFTSDGAWSDEDDLWDTDGACQYDEVRVTVDDVEVDFEDFEDGESQRWEEGLAQPFWDFDFAQIWTELQDLDPCVDNHSPQVAFIDTGEQSVHTDGTPCITWCYGPGGYITYNSNAWGNPSNYSLDNAIISPVLEWPAGCDGAQLDFSAYVHEELSAQSPAIFVRWHVRSVNTGDADDLNTAYWRSFNFLHYGGPDYRRFQRDVSHLLEPGCTHAQVILHAWQYDGWAWFGDDGTPAPYFDNVQFKAYARREPILTAYAAGLFHDAFPTSGVVDMADLAANSVRLDATGPNGSTAVPADSIQVDVSLLRPDAVLVEPPRLHVRMLANPVFDVCRQLPAGFTQQDGVVTGVVDGVNSFGGDTFRFDLPDEGFFFPGDVLRTYVRAVSEVDGAMYPAILPADTAGFASPLRDARYVEAFEVRALPTVRDEYGLQPSVLFWQQGHDDEGQRWWLNTLAEAYEQLGVSYDLYATNQPGAVDADGLGGRVPASALAGYDILVYTSGRLSRNLSDGDANGYWDDVALLTEWFQLGDKSALFCGDHVLHGLSIAGAEAQVFADTYLGAELEASDVRPFISDQYNPLVVPQNNGIIWLNSVGGWIVNGGCPSVRQVDAVIAGPAAESYAEFTDPGGNPGIYPYTACWDHQNWTDEAHVVGLPYDLRAVADAPGFPPPPGMTAASALLVDILYSFRGTICDVDPTPPAITTATCYPNPFNPTTTIKLDLARSGPVRVRMYDVRGRQVRELVDERLTAGRHELAWDGVDDRGRAVSSGVYFCEVQAGEATLVEKLTMVK